MWGAAVTVGPLGAMEVRVCPRGRGDAGGTTAVGTLVLLPRPLALCRFVTI